MYTGRTKLVITYSYHQVVAIDIATKQPDERRAAG